VNEGENGDRFAEMMKKDLPQVSPIFCYEWHKQIHYLFYISIYIKLKFLSESSWNNLLLQNYLGRERMITDSI
jgi:hypothetical protein